MIPTRNDWVMAGSIEDASLKANASMEGTLKSSGYHQGVAGDIM
jgi:hypothetical protein